MGGWAYRNTPRLMLFLCVLSGGNEFSRVSNILLTNTQSVESVKSVAVFYFLWGTLCPR